MEKQELKLIPSRERDGAGEARPLVIWTLIVILLVGAVVASMSGADRVRRQYDPRELAESALRQAFMQGSDDDAVLMRLHDLRRELGRRPLDSRTRVVYASLLLSLSSSASELSAPAFHARLAADLAPVTVPIVRMAALVLASTGESDDALALIRDMFGFDHAAAAALLGQAEKFLGTGLAELAVPDTPAALLAWSRELSKYGRQEESAAWLERAHQRFPGNFEILAQVAESMVQSGDWAGLETLFFTGTPLTESRETASLMIYRARARLYKGDVQGARNDIERALQLGGNAAYLQTLAGDAYFQMGAFDEAKRNWNAALFQIGADQVDRRRYLLLRLARLEDRHGRPAAALRMWRQLLEIDPEHEEARRRIAALTGA